MVVGVKTRSVSEISSPMSAVLVDRSPGSERPLSRSSEATLCYRTAKSESEATYLFRKSWF